MSQSWHMGGGRYANSRPSVFGFACTRPTAARTAYGGTQMSL